ncbi:PepSY domain-containing protein [Kingella oralis]|uniref:PepSY domain-containing protein n=1 Tax=Kingella oralis TaxID=505 RepID=UPI002D8043FB|nr:PepSY domain-containing protein [Kingella oralis]
MAVAKVGGGQATEVEFDRSRNKPDHFDVDVRTANGQKYEVEVDAKTGAVLSSQLDD